MHTVRRVQHLMIKPVVLAALALSLSGCQFRPEPLAATAYNEKDEVEVHLTLRAAHALTITRRELYARLTLINCDGSGRGFPASPPIEGGRIPGNSTLPQDGTVQITARVPTRIYAQYTKPCVFLNGGGYFTGTIKSGMVPIVRDHGLGPNNSFKPNPLRSGNGVAG